MADACLYKIESCKVMAGFLKTALQTNAPYSPETPIKYTSAGSLGKKAFTAGMTSTEYLATNLMSSAVAASNEKCPRSPKHSHLHPKKGGCVLPKGKLTHHLVGANENQAGKSTLEESQANNRHPSQATNANEMGESKDAFPRARTNCPTRFTNT